MTSGSAKDIAEVVSVAGEIIGRTRLQKTMVILEMSGLGYGFPFSYHLFGPFSEEVFTAADRAAALGYVHEDAKRSSWGGFYSIFRAEKRPSDCAARDQIIDIAKSSDSIVLELAATAAFLAKEGHDDPWGEVSARKPDKATKERLVAARALYRKFLEVQTPQPLPQII